MRKNGVFFFCIQQNSPFPFPSQLQWFTSLFYILFFHLVLSLTILDSLIILFVSFSYSNWNLFCLYKKLTVFQLLLLLFYLMFSSSARREQNNGMENEACFLEYFPFGIFPVWKFPILNFSCPILTTSL